MAADPYFGGIAIYDSFNNFFGDPWNQFGGTSLATPLWAGLVAIADQGRVLAGGTTLDGASQTLPALYSLPSYDFNDIVAGDNEGHGAAARLRHGHGPGDAESQPARPRPGGLWAGQPGCPRDRGAT